MNLRFGSVCSGIESASVAWHPLGWRAAWLAEIEPFPSAVLAHHYPDVPNLGDMTAIAARIRAGEIEAPDVLVGGTPCQAFSVAGARAGLADPRGQLTLAYVDLANAIDAARAVRGQQPVVTVWENVPGVLSSKDNAFGCFLGALAGESCELQPPGGKWKDAGCVFGPSRAIAWRVFDAQYFGLAQRRRRVFVVASARKDIDPAAVLFEFEGVRRDSAPSREAGQAAAAGTLRSTDGGSDVDHARAGHLQPIGYRMVAFGEYADDGTASTMKERDYKDATDLAVQCVTGDITHTLKAEGFDASEDGTGRGHPIVPVLSVHGTQDPDVRVEHAHTLGRNNGQENAIAYPLQEIGKRTGTSTTDPRAGMGIGNDGDPMFTLQASAQHGVAYALQDTSGRDKAQNGKGWSDHGVSYTIDAAATQGVAYSVALRGREGGATAELGDDLAGCLRASSGGGDKPHVLTRLAVRRLTPVECERLQGFPDGYTLIPVKQANVKAVVDGDEIRLISGVKWKMAADGPRYKALGNSMAVPCMRFIGARIDLILRANTGSVLQPDGAEMEGN